jgi:hypothetical protein
LTHCLGEIDGIGETGLTGNTLSGLAKNEPMNIRIYTPYKIICAFLIEVQPIDAQLVHFCTMYDSPELTLEYN